MAEIIKNIKDYDYIVVGAGLAGGVIARKLADDGNQILIVERRNHIAGNIFDYNVRGIKVQKYGPHVFHTNEEKIYEFITNFTDPVPYRTKCEVIIDGINTPSPFNFKTIDQFYPEDEAAALKKKLLECYGNRTSVTVLEMAESGDEMIRSYAEFLFEKDYKPYTAKQWGVSTAEIDPSVLKRVPVLLSYRNTYFGDKYEFMPKDGFEMFYEKLTDSSSIDILTGVDALNHLSFSDENMLLYDDTDIQIIYTGAIDELFDFKYGVLPYRSLWFDFMEYPQKNYQNTAITAYPQEKGFTRITEYTKMPYQDNRTTVIAVEYPVKYDMNSEKGNEPYYPVLTKDSSERYKKYKDYSRNIKNLTICGRLADFKYYNMDQVILRAMQVYDRIKRNRR